MTTSVGEYQRNGQAAKGGVSVGQVLGVAGLLSLGGQVQEEFLTELKTWSKAVKWYKEMLEDPVIGTVVDAVKLPLLAADFDVTPGDDSPVAQQAADWLWANMQHMANQTWRSHVADMLESVEWGFAIGEITLERRGDGRLWLQNIDPRGQDTLWKWEIDAHDATTAFIQRDPDTGKTISIPIAKTVHVTQRGRKGNPEGKPLLRSLFRPWRFLKELENFEGIGIEHDVGGMPVFKLLKPVESYTAGDITALKATAEGIRQDEKLYVLLPPDVELSAYGGGSGEKYNIADVIQRKKQECLMRVFAQFLMLGMDNVGTQALVQGSTDFFMLGLEATQQSLVEAWQGQLVRFLFRFNAPTFPGLVALPQIVWHKPGKVDTQALLTAYGMGVTARALTPIREDEEHIRAVLGLPDLPEGEGAAPRDLPVPGVLTPDGFEWPGFTKAARP